MMNRLLRKLGLERCKRCGWCRADHWLGRGMFCLSLKDPCPGPCTYETCEGLQ